MDFALISLIVGAIAAIAGSAISSGVNARNVRQTNQANRDIAAMQNQWNVEQWQRENQYNLPENQVARLSAAGINPALAMSQSGIVDAGNASQMHPAAGATMQPFQMENIGSSIGSSIQNIGLQQSQIDANNAYAENQRAQAKETTDLLPEKVRNLSAQTDELKQSVTNMQKQVETMDATIRNLDQDTAKKAFETSHTLFLESLYDKEFDLNLRKFNEHDLPLLKSEVGLKAAQKEYYKGLERLNFRNLTEMFYTFRARMYGLDLDNGLKAGKILLTESDVRRNEAYINLLGFDLETKQFNSLFSGQDWIMDRPNAKALISGANGAAQIFSSTFVKPLFKPLEDAGYGGFNSSFKKIDINHFKK